MALTKLHNLILSGEIISEIENEHDGLIKGHSKDGNIHFDRLNGYCKLTVERKDNKGKVEYNLRYPDEYRSFVMTLVWEFK